MLDLSAYYIRFSFYLFNSPTHTEFYTLSLHDALPILIEERRDFESKRFAAIEKFSNRPDLWDEWRKLYREDSPDARSEEHTSELQSRGHLVCRLLLEKKKKNVKKRKTSEEVADSILSV